MTTQEYLDLERALWECEQAQGNSDVVTPEHEAVLDAMERWIANNRNIEYDRKDP